MEIRRLESDNTGDWFDFFDSRAFADHADWQGCYCTAFFYPKLKEYPSGSRTRRNYADWLIRQGLMKGYLAYEGDRVVGWCNVNVKSAFPRLHGSTEPEPGVLSVACFIIEKEHRGKGIAKKILDTIVEDARRDGNRMIEAYPHKKSRSQFGNWHGPYSIFEKKGFQFEETAAGVVARLSL